MPKIKTRRKMGWILIAFHWTMIVCTVGLWTPVYLAARRRRVTVTHMPPGYPAAPMPQTQPYPPAQPYPPYGQQPAPYGQHQQAAPYHQQQGPHRPR